MNENDIERVIEARLHEADIGLPSAWPNATAVGVLPRLEVSYFGGDATDDALSGGGAIEKITVGVNITVVVKEGGSEHTDEANRIAGLVKALYPGGLRLPIEGGHVLVRGQTSIRKGFTGDGGWRTPVVLQLLAQN